MVKRLLAYLIKKVGVFLSFCGVTGSCIVVLIGVIADKVLSHKSNELAYSLEWMSRDHHPYFVALYIIICVVAIVLLRKNYIKQNNKLLSSKQARPADEVLKNV